MKHVAELLSAYLDGEVNPAEKAAVETHLPQCESCRKKLDQLRALTVQIQAHSGAHEPPAGFIQRIKNNLGKAPAPKSYKPWLRPVAAVAFAGLLSAFMIRQFQNTAQQLSAPISSATSSIYYDSLPESTALETAQSASDEIMEETMAARSAGAAAKRSSLPGMEGALSAALPFKSLPPPPEDGSCSKNEPTPCPEMKLKEYTSRGWMGDDGPPEKRQFIVRTQEEWEKTWTKVSKKPTPKIDFEKEIVAVVFGGKLPGYVVAINGSEEMPEGKIIIYYRLTPPNPMMKTRSGDFPYAIRTLPKTDLPVEFQEQ